MLGRNYPLISVIIPALNEEDYISNCLESLKNQDYLGNIEIIVVDNGSVDKTAEIAKKYDLTLVLETRRGIARALKTGCREAQGEILAFTDADCHVPKYWLSRIFEIFEADRNIVAAGGDYYFYENEFLPRIIFNRIIVPFISFSFRLFFFRKYPSLPNSNMALRRNIYEKAGGYNPDIKWGQEIELCSRISKFGKIFFDPNLKVGTSFRRYSKEYNNQFLAFFLALKETSITVFRFFPITFLGKGMTPQKPVRKKITHAISKNTAPSKRVALTFDDGPYGKATEKILDILKTKNVKVTFFVLGINVKKYPKIIERELQEGHLIGIHGYTHSPFMFIKNSHEIIKDISKTAAEIHAALSLRPLFFRPPYGFRSPWMKKALKSRGYSLIPLDIMTSDYNSKTKPKKITEHIVRKIRSGSIITLHDGRDTEINYSRENVIQALPEIIDGIRAKGFEIVPLDQLIGEEAYF